MSLSEQDEFEQAFNEASDENVTEEVTVSEDSTDDKPVEVDEPQEEQDTPPDTTDEQPEVEQEVEAKADTEPPKEEPQINWEHKYKSNAGRINAYQKQIQQLQDQLKQSEQVVQKEPEPEKTQVSDGPDAWSELVETDPDLAKAIEQRFSKHKAPEDPYKNDINELKQFNEQMRRQQQQLADQQALTEIHPDWQDVARSDQFKTWINEQPHFIQKTYHEDGSVQSAADLISMFKHQHQAVQPSNPEVGEIQQKRKQAMLNSATQVKGTKTTPVPGDPDDFESAFNYFSKQRDKTLT